MELNLKILWTLLVIVFAFTAIDFIAHKAIGGELDEVGPRYYQNKILFAFPALVFLFLLRVNENLAALIVVLLLNVRYLNIFSVKFNIATLILHYVILAFLLRANSQELFTKGVY